MTGRQTVGRQAELRQMVAALEGLERGRGAVVEITGEPGAGKTQLACELADQAARRGIPVLWARATRSGEGDHQVFRDMVGPAVASGTVDLDAWCELLQQRASGGLLVVDDLHLADPASVELVLRLARAASVAAAPASAPSASVRTTPPAPVAPGTTGAAFVLVLVHRPRQSPPALVEALDLGVRTDTVFRVEACPLDRPAVAALLGDRYGAASGSGSDTVTALHAASRGLPGYLRLLVAARFDPALWPDRAGHDEDALPREAAALLAEVGGLSGPARATARAASVLGRTFRPTDAARIAGLDAREGLAACAELLRADLVRPADQGRELTFRHPAVGRVVHASCELPQLLDAHRQALRIAVERGAPALERARYAEYLAHTDGPAAARLLAEGAAEALTRAPELAARWLRLALDALPAPGIEQELSERAAWELAHGRALIAAGRLTEARALAHHLLTESGHRPSAPAAAPDPETDHEPPTPPDRTPGPGLPSRLLPRAYALCAAAERLLCRYQEAEAIARTGMALLPRPLPAVLSVEATELVYEYGLVHVLRGTHDRIRPLLREAARSRTEAGPAASTALRVLIAFCDVFSGDTARGAAEVARCAALVDALPDGVAGHTPDTLTLLGCAELYLERFPDARRHLLRGLDAATGGAQKHIRAHQLLGLTMIDQWAGRLGAAQRRAAEAEELARAVGAPDVVTLATAMRAMTLVWSRGQEHAGEAVALAARAVDTVALGRGWWATSAISLLAHAQLLGGDAAGCLRTLLDGGGGAGLPDVQPAFRPSLLALMALAALADGDAEHAGQLLADAEADAERLGLPLQWACVHRAAAQLCSARGEHTRSLELFERAAEGFRTGGLPVQYAWTLIAAAPVTAAVRGPAAALGLVERAEALARPCGAALVLEKAGRLRAHLTAVPGPHPAAAPGPPTVRSPLSDREREVADLAAAGLRSRQIAERLFLSHRTVESHLGNAYRKLGVSSRTALARVLGPAPGAGLQPAGAEPEFR
ncbi:helix-turn-helix transcriptional regulator [Kitasatospora albolonga]|uniref:helix-turn-helix transcriptional regulator n=1 Tax=Kitasatospora albolonga TaxID=68173 RepID=UPI0031E9C448